MLILIVESYQRKSVLTAVIRVDTAVPVETLYKLILNGMTGILLAMKQTSRIAVSCLWVLMQFFAPLVHAHEGGGHFSGTLHVPGLEFLVKANGKSAQAFNYKGCNDVIVSLASGLKSRGDKTTAAPDTDFEVPAKLSFTPGLPSKPGMRSPTSHVASPLLFWPTSAPRAPPSQG